MIPRVSCETRGAVVNVFANVPRSNAPVHSVGVGILVRRIFRCCENTPAGVCRGSRGL